MSDLQDLVRKRGATKRKLTLFAKYLTGFDKAIESEECISDIHLIEIEERMSRAKTYLEEFEDSQNLIESTTDDPDAQYAVRESFEEEYYQQIAKAKLIILKNERRQENVDSVSEASTRSTRQVVQQAVKLPTIELPKFNGTYQNWIEFRDMFESLIHCNSTINDVQKFHYLKSTLTDEAAEVIKSMEFTAENYTIAWDILRERYSNTRLLVHNHIKAIFNLEQIGRESAFKIRKLIDDVSKNLRALKALNQETEAWDTIIIYLITTKLDSCTIKEWENYKASNELPTLGHLKEFLKSKADLLETLEANVTEKRLMRQREHIRSKSLFTTKQQCVCCEGDHFIQNCEKFLAMSSERRTEHAKKGKLCINCLRKGHFAKNCKSGACKKCKQHHNTLLHPDSSKVEREQSKDENNVSLSCCTSTEGQIILATARILCIDEEQRAHEIRAILDSGSQSSFISKELCKRLNLRMTHKNLEISGLGQATSKIEGKCKVRIKSQHDNFNMHIQCLVLPTITGYLPNIAFSKTLLNIPRDIALADPEFNVSKRVDMLLGADCFWHLIRPEQIKLGKNLPILQSTKIGWVISGPMGITNEKRVQCNFSANIDIQQQLERFWEIEECTSVKAWSEEEIACENHFVAETTRDAHGRFVVSLPLKEPMEMLGESRQQAKTRFLSLERKLQREARLKDMYKEFMAEYEFMNHMTEVDENDDAKTTYYLPHHCVLREQSLTTKLRVVFDASARTTTGYSLNDIQMVGPTVQEDLLCILLRFRKHAYVISADITKMYRQVQIKQEQRSLQRILWRADPTEKLRAYNLNTVTYGTAAASFLAIRSLHQLAEEHRCINPKITEVIQRDFYVDDLLTGADSCDDAMRICQEVTEVLGKGCFELRKFVSNKPEVLTNVVNQERSQLKFINLGENENTKTLGLNWYPQEDRLGYNIGKNLETQSVTKRTVLSSTAQVFDPLGLLCPCIIIAKIILQKLWLEKLNWDEELPEELLSAWLIFKTELPSLNCIRIPRQVVYSNHTSVEIHGFADASENAYGGCIYIRNVKQNGSACVNLLCAKAKVAPLKTISIPRLELCAALTLARLFKKVQTAMNIKASRNIFWTDSTIVLGWLKLPPRCLKTFVNNRVSEIQELSSKSEWRHVPTKENPADILSRGVNPTKIEGLHMWWCGPKWLSESEEHWPKGKNTKEELPEIRIKNQSFVATNAENSFPFEKFSNLTRLKRVMAYIIRFKTNCQSDKKGREKKSLSMGEISDAFKSLIKIAQMESFPQEIRQLDDKREISPKSRILSLNPSMDEEGVLRVGGRIEHAEFSYEKRHPIILDSKHHLTSLIFEDGHRKLHHAGPQLLLATMRREFWPIAGRNLSRKIVRSCITCFKHKPKTIQAVMGNIPPLRLQPSPPFHTTGVDYAGPLLSKDRKGRGSRLSKCYVCVFVCFVTKALHLELVTDLTKDAFMLSLRRFVARRGKPGKIFSDNGTNFVGAKAELNQLSTFLTDNADDLKDACVREDIDWAFIPPYSPHFGGLWEAGVKSVKHHLRRVLGNAHLTFEELYTVLVQIEAILNSRPLSPLSSHPYDLLPLTPAHFLVGRPLTSVPDEDLKGASESRLSLHQRIQMLTQHFWQRWKNEYISELQQRTKWKQSKGELKKGALVLLKDDQLPPMRWKLGRIEELHPGQDGTARVASIRTSTGIVRRAVVKICPLPIEATSTTRD